MEKKAEQLRLLQSMMGGGDDKLEQKVDQVLALVLRIGEEQVAIKERLSRVELSCNNQVAGVDGIEDKITMIQDAVLVFNGKVGELQNCITSVGESASAAKSSADGAKRSADGAKSSADGAKSSAEGAKRVAEEAKNLAGGAKSSADGAKQVAEDAKRSADGAKSSADGAKSSADGAQQIATVIQNNQKKPFGWNCSSHGWQSAEKCVSNLRNSRLCTTKN